jgi:hypothetical protein
LGVYYPEGDRHSLAVPIAISDWLSNSLVLMVCVERKNKSFERKPMGSMADRNKGISRFASDRLETDGLTLYEKWFAHLQQLSPGQKILDTDVRDQILEEIVSSASEGNSLILNKKDKNMIEELVNRFLIGHQLLEKEV